MSNPADAENARVEKLLMDRLLDRQARFGGRLTVARELQVGDRFLTGAGGPGGDQPETLIMVDRKVNHVLNRETVLYMAAGAGKRSWLSADQEVLILPRDREGA